MARKTRRTSSTTVSVSAGGSSRAGAEFNPDYSIVKSDLRRIGVLAGIFTAALIILSFIIP